MRHFRILTLGIAIAITQQIAAQETTSANDSIVNAYADSLSTWVQNQDSVTAPKKSPAPYLFRIFAPGTVYSTALAQNMAITPMTIGNKTVFPSLGSVTDPSLLLNEAMNDQLNIAYTQHPGLFVMTQDELTNTSKIRNDLSKKVENKSKVAEEVVPMEKPIIDITTVNPEVKKPNFWTLKGNGRLQFTESYFSDNWYQGGEQNYTMLSQLTGEANYNNKRKIQWDNKLEAQLGFQTSENTEPKFRATSNLLRLTSNLGIKAIGRWNYSAQLQLETQPYMNYDKKGENVTADFISPLYVRSSIGMDYNIQFKKLTGKLHLAPLSYVITYVDRDALIGRHGIKEGHNSKHDWGPNIDLNFTYKIMDNISWKARVYWFSNLELTRIEWENTIDFSINKYLTSTLFLYPRYDDSSTKYKAGENHDGDYWMFKQWLSLGVSYDF